jgi:hypothetical protein
MKKVKKIAKYTTNILGMVSMLIVGINAIDGVDIPNAMVLVQIIAVIQGVIGTYLIQGKLWGGK